MSSLLPEKDRHTVPRWRDFKSTAQTGELQSLAPGGQAFRHQDVPLEKALAAWKTERSPSSASELISAALLAQKAGAASDAATFILSLPEGVVSKPLRRIASLVQTGESAGQQVLDFPLEEKGIGEVRGLIRGGRERLRDEPRNALLWTDLALWYAVLGQAKQSTFAVDMASALAPDNRFVIRSAVRQHLHFGDPEAAHDIVNRAAVTPHDPWLLASELAVSSLAGRSSRFFKTGRATLDSGRFSAFQTSELASALAMIEYENGRTTQTRRLFRTALVDPNENTVAQAIWATRHASLGGLLQAHHLEVPRSFEARAWSNYLEGRWREATKNAHSWLADEPFASRPATFGSYVAATMLGDYTESERIARLGLAANPSDPVLLNNLAFALASSDRLPEALETFGRIPTTGFDRSMEVVYEATHGLLEFRASRPVKGREHYENALRLARAYGFGKMEAMASIFLAREETLAGISSAHVTRARAIEGAAAFRDPDMLQLLKMLASLTSTLGDRQV